MDNMNELTSSLSFASSSYISNGSSTCHNNVFASATTEPGQSLETLSLGKLSSSLEKLLIDDEFADYTDAEIVVEGVPVSVHRCILASRSQFFHELFKKKNPDSMKEGKPRYLMTDLVPYGKVGVEAFDVFLNYLYTGTGKLKASPEEISTCVDENCAHDACPPAINYAVELMYASATFQMKELVLLVQRRLLNFVEKAYVEDVIPIVVAAYHCQLKQLLTHAIERVAKSPLDDVVLEKELPLEVSSQIKSWRRKSQQEEEDDEDTAMENVVPVQDKRVGRILKALDSDDVELVELLLKESDITLDDAYALHYAVAYCDPKVVKEVLGLNLADVNLRNPRGLTVLHVAARRKEPSLIVALLDRGASSKDTTSDDQTAVSICRRLTRPKDYHENTCNGHTKRGKESNKDRICIDVLEREMRRNSISANMSMETEPVGDDLVARLVYFENRVAFARLLFPAEARLAMEMADAHETSMYTTSLSGSGGSSGNLKEVDLNERPAERTRRLRARLHALIKTVEKGRRFFPHCSEVLDNFLDYEIDMPDVYVLEKGTPEEQAKKKMRFIELKEDLQKAFSKDMENSRSGLSSSSSSSSSQKETANNRVRKRNS
ncbi:BTB/POZ domain and ankyrin repeat-containing protein NPR1-like [Humulus lupulus]|uniref:BTB/POZ domain and ankyrin repeat-containing protein NPR1-like n=1 Tax=Humulus lupulus TaxID=3486 RepID=UPI002B413AEF|nr:BTB/POZ domain and ankyrin repeat-containing protein NPR1-like [Humulus lupulus]